MCVCIYCRRANNDDKAWQSDRLWGNERSGHVSEDEVENVAALGVGPTTNGIRDFIAYDSFGMISFPPNCTQHLSKPGAGNIVSTLYLYLFYYLKKCKNRITLHNTTQHTTNPYWMSKIACFFFNCFFSSNRFVAV